MTRAGGPWRARGMLGERAWLSLMLGTFAVWALPPAVTAQRGPGAGGATAVVAPPWMLAWSPLSPIADLPRSPLSPPRIPALLLLPAPRVGALWSAGSPADVAREARDTLSMFAGGLAHSEGSFRRPLDPQVSDSRELQGVGWRAIRARGAGVVHVLIENELAAPASFGDAVTPYGSSPLFVSDTSLPDMRRIRVQLEGAVGYRLGAWGIGVGLGVETQDYRTSNARFPRQARAALPGASVGVSRSLPLRGALRAGVHARWLGGSETLILSPIPEFGQAFRHAGYADPDPVSVQRPGNLYRRADRDATAVGGSLAGQSLGARWTVMVQRESRSERQINSFGGSAHDDWNANGYAAAAALQRPVMAGRVLVTVGASLRSLDGDATRADLTGIVFQSSEQLLRVGGEARYATADSSWLMAVSGNWEREERERADFVSEVRTEITRYLPEVGLEVARRLDARTHIAISGAGAFAGAAGRIPNAAAQGPVYQRIFAPEIAISLAESRPIAGALTLSRMVGERSTAWIRVQGTSATGTIALPLLPDGDRVGWGVIAGVMMR